MKLKNIAIGLCITVACLAIALLAGCTVPQVVTNPDGSTSTNHVVDPRLATAIATGQAVNTATGGVNPYAPVVNISLGTALAIAAWFAKRKNDQATQWADVAGTIIQGIEAAGTSAAEVKRAIEARSVSDGNKLLVDQVVQKELS